MRNQTEKLIGMFPPKLQRTARQFIKFGVTGTMGAVIDFGSFNILRRGLGWDAVYDILGQPIIAANLVSVALAIFIMFFVNKYWTFRNQSKDVVKQGIGYFALNGVTFVLNQLLTSFFAFRVGLVEAVFGSQTDNAAKALAIGIILFVNFAGSKFLVFKKKDANPAPAQQL